MRATEFITEAKVPPVRDQIIADVKKNGPGEYFVRVTDVDKLGFSARQKFGRSPDMDDPAFDVDYIGAGKGRPALWFYPLSEYLKHNDLYATESPYVWLVKLKDTAWLQPARRGASGVSNPPKDKQRVGIMRYSNPPAAIFFEPGFDVVGKYYDYAGQHKRHGEVKGAPKPTFFDRVRGVAETINTDIFDKKFNHKQVIGDYTYTAELVNDFSGPALKIQAFDKNKCIGRVYFTLRGDAKLGGLESTGTKVDPEYQKQGVASTMYAYAKMLGNDIIRSPIQSRAGRKMWNAWDKSGDAQHLTGNVDENFDDGKNPGRKGLSRRVGIPKKATLAQLEKIAGSSTGERRRMAQWQLNMRRGKKK